MRQKSFFTGILGMGVGMVVFFLLANLAFWGGLIYFAFWCAKHFGLL